MCKDLVERPRYFRQVERVDEQTRVVDLPAAPAAHETPKLLLRLPTSPRRLLLERAERAKLSLTVNELFDGLGTESADELILQIGHAHVETESFQIGASEVGAQAGPLEAALEVAFLRGVTEARQLDVQPLRAEPLQKASDRLRTAHWHDRNSFSSKIPTTALSQRFERELIADPLNKHNRTCEEGLSRLRAGETRDHKWARLDSNQGPTDYESAALTS